MKVRIITPNRDIAELVEQAEHLRNAARRYASGVNNTDEWRLISNAYLRCALWLIVRYAAKTTTYADALATLNRLPAP